MSENKSKTKTRYLALGLLLAAVPVVYFLLDHPTEQKRNISSITQDHDLSESSPEEFQRAFKYQVLREATALQTPQGPAVRLGSFMLKNESGNKVFVCEQYPTIDLVFVVEGMAFSGEIPTMIVRGPCTIAADQEHLELLSIPFEQILKSSTQVYEFSEEKQNNDPGVRVFFKNIPEFWPREWTWTGIKLYGKNPDDVLSINGYEIISVLGSPLTIKAAPNE